MATERELIQSILTRIAPTMKKTDAELAKAREILVEMDDLASDLAEVLA